MENLFIIRAFGEIARNVQMMSNLRFKELGLNNNLFIYIIRITEKPGMFISELSFAVQNDRSTAFRSVKKLEEMGYFCLKDDAVNQKIKRVYPTTKAKAIYPQLHAFEQSCSDSFLAGLSESEQKILEMLLQKVHANI